MRKTTKEDLILVLRAAGCDLSKSALRRKTYPELEAMVEATTPRDAGHAREVADRQEQPETTASTADETAQAQSKPQPIKEPEIVADAVKLWRGNYNTVGAPAAEVLAESFTDLHVWTVGVSAMLRQTHIAGPSADTFCGSLAQWEASALAAMKVWQRTLDRKDAADMERYNQNRSFLAGFYAATAARLANTKRLPQIPFASDMEKAIRPEALKAGAAAGKNADLDA